jgi:hypothetical protein
LFLFCQSTILGIFGLETLGIYGLKQPKRRRWRFLTALTRYAARQRWGISPIKASAYRFNQRWGDVGDTDTASGGLLDISETVRHRDCDLLRQGAAGISHVRAANWMGCKFG